LFSNGGLSDPPSKIFSSVYIAPPSNGTESLFYSFRDRNVRDDIKLIYKNNVHGRDFLKLRPGTASRITGSIAYGEHPTPQPLTATTRWANLLEPLDF